MAGTATFSTVRSIATSTTVPTSTARTIQRRGSSSAVSVGGAFTVAFGGGGAGVWGPRDRARSAAVGPGRRPVRRRGQVGAAAHV